jgi:predicted ATPase/DNA-binding winged helix-turn-helix (wHTH) protein
VQSPPTLHSPGCTRTDLQPLGAAAELAFGACVIRPHSRQVWVGGKAVRLGARAFGLLLTLVHNRDRVVPRSELLAAVWPGEAVNDNNLNVQIAALRKALGPHAVTTIPGRGYRFTLPDDEAAEAVPARPPPALVNPLSNLPLALGELLGRGEDLTALMALLPEQALISVIGAGGIGKTRLALEAAHAQTQSDGVWWVELSTLAPGADADAVCRAIAAAIGLNLGTSKAPVEALRIALRPLAALIVLDNAEHVAQSAADVVGGLQSAPSLRWLVTSQVPLKLQHEQLFALGTLSVPPEGAGFEQAMNHGALALLVQRARASNHRYQLSEVELPAAIGICRQLDGIALALEMAASRLAWIGAEALNRRLAKSLSGLGPGSRAAPTRQQTLKAALDWSHALLTLAEQVVLRRLGVFVGGFTLEAAQHVAADEDGLDEWAVLDALFGLAEKSWVQVGQGNQPRYHLLESARRFALEQLGAAVEESAVRARHADAMAALADRFMEFIWSERWESWEAWLHPESDNLAAAFDRSIGSGQAHVAARVFVALVRSMDGNRLYDLLARADALRPLLTGLPPALVARAMVSMGVVKMAFDPVAAIAVMREALALRRGEAGDAYWLQYNLALLSQCLTLTGQRQEALQLFDEARAMQQPDSPPWLEVSLGATEVITGLFSGNAEAAIEPALRTIRLAEAIGALDASLRARSNLIAALVELKRHDEAIQMAAEFSSSLVGPRFARLRLLMLLNLMLAQMRTGALAKAHRSASEALPLTHTCGLRMALLDQVCELALLQGRPEAAAQLIGQVQGAEAAGRSLPQPSQLSDRLKVLDDLTTQLSAGELAHWLARGAALNDEQIDALVRDGPPDSP